MRRFGTAEEAATLVLFLLPDDSAYMTGAELAIDDGASL
jgi:3alpha(or 20beta)-hydroxysteroid dehydrogenase